MSISREVLAKYITPGCTFVESGTRWADTSIAAIKLGAKRAFTVETNDLMASMARLHANDAVPHYGIEMHPIEILLGSSERVFSEGYFKKLICDQSTVVWLDAHTETHSPVLEELQAISGWPARPEVIMIDDMRLMQGWGISRGKIMEKLIELKFYHPPAFEAGVVSEDILVVRG